MAFREKPQQDTGKRFLWSKHQGKPVKQVGQLKIAGLEMNLDTRECSLDGSPLLLTPTEFTLLKILCQCEGMAVSSQELFQGIWGDECCINCCNTINVHIRHIREKMHEITEHPKYIKTVWGIGYKVDAED
jgi:two-component system response regulator VanR